MTTSSFSPDIVADLGPALDAHPLYAQVQTLDDLRTFMAHHVYSVWDFMSLLKCLQGHIAPTRVPWKPLGSAEVRFFINQIVVGEECDDGLPDAAGNPTHASHFELYCDAMREVGADPTPAIRFADTAADHGIDAALALGLAPPAAAQFMRSTFGFIATGKPHVVGAAFALGREHIIPAMFRALLAKMGIDAKAAPAFHFYLERHIHLDEDFHAPLALRMVNELVGGDAAKLAEANAAARQAVQARIAFWDGVQAALK
ncbi:DUF3050 domain-containing protein [Caldichromatium japonicum]|uniref:DUF3050 domain-containing protein n=1 Tax=Caldichromatium japonicum TaxID=2699430 RepID=A0A6G7VEQ8_9GAMM|nr:DUF3050 domain-containing protein [Caldichromatium japonicum]QIK38563.1 DUF3050 domain-containing protein [Caldichromatium japonicum]